MTKGLYLNMLAPTQVLAYICYVVTKSVPILLKVLQEGLTNANSIPLMLLFHYRSHFEWIWVVSFRNR